MTFRCGHAKTPENTYMASDKYSRCRTCKNDMQRAYNLRTGHSGKRRHQSSPRIKQLKYDAEALTRAMG